MTNLLLFSAKRKTTSHKSRGRPSTWKAANYEETKHIRVPIAIADALLRLRRQGLDVDSIVNLLSREYSPILQQDFDSLQSIRDSELQEHNERIKRLNDIRVTEQKRRQQVETKLVMEILKLREQLGIEDKDVYLGADE